MKYFDILPRKERMNKFAYELFQMWHCVLCQYEAEWQKVAKLRQEPNDLPYVYNEQAQIGLLAIAGKLIGGFPFIEFNQDKYTWSGRGQQDLEIISANDKIWSIEAKYLEIKRKTPKLEVRLQKKMESAICNVYGLQNRDLGKSIAVVFFRPWGYKRGNAHEDFRKDIESLDRRSLGCDFLAYHLCQEDILNKSQHPDSPGVAILGKHVD